MIRIKNNFPAIKGLDAELKSIVKQFQDIDKKLINFKINGGETAIAGGSVSSGASGIITTTDTTPPINTKADKLSQII